MPVKVYEFGCFRLDLRERQLARDGCLIPLRGKVLDTLGVLVQNAGKLLRKDELMKIIWTDRTVEENNLEHNLSVLRKVLAQGNGECKFIETVPRYGYRFVAEVRAISETTANFAPPQRRAGDKSEAGQES
ncbi:MAG TPA: winged helix-turn-helix domain-containing protein [Terriglobales bacterium]|nr:winged helix-turn-helix domain-containing protein [Terriglobales bacterium]